LLASFVAAVFLASAALGAAAKPCTARQAAQSVLFVGPDSDVGRQHFATLVERVEVRGTTKRHCVRLDFLPANVNGPGLESKLMEAKNLRPRIVLTPNGVVTKAVLSAMPEAVVLFYLQDDPVASGLAASLLRPGGRATGVSAYAPIQAKQIELLHDAYPSIRRVVLIGDLWFSEMYDAGALRRQLAATLGIELRFILTNSWGELEDAMRREMLLGVDGWVVERGYLAFEDSFRMARLLAATRRPTISGDGNLTDAGGLMSYETEPDHPIRDVWPVMLDRVLDGARVGDIPIELPSHYDFLINADVAAAANLPPAILRRATQIVRTKRK